MSNRVLFQTTTVNGNTFLGAIPNGAGTQSGLLCINNAAPANSAFAGLTISATSALLNSGVLGTGTQIPLAFAINGTEKMRLSNGGNLLIGTTTDAGQALQVATTAAIGGNTTVGGTIGVTGLSTLTGGLTTPANVTTTGTGTLVIAGTSTLGGVTTVNAGAFTPVVVIAYGTTITMNCNLSDQFRMVFGTGNVTTFTITNPNNGQVINFRIKQDSIGSRTIAWPASFRWNGGLAPVLSTAPNAQDFLSMQYDSTDSTWVCTLLKGVQ